MIAQPGRVPRDNLNSKVRGIKVDRSLYCDRRLLIVLFNRRMKSSAAKVNPDIARERQTASFNPTELTYLLYGGREKTERKRFLGELIPAQAELCNCFWKGFVSEMPNEISLRESLPLQF